MKNYNSMNDCCCSCGLKMAICILEDLILSGTYIDSYVLYYSCGNSSGKIVDSKYPNFILLQESLPDKTTLNINLCVEDIDYVKITPSGGIYSNITNELNKYYISPSVIQPKCQENCCCKASVTAYIKDKYMESELNKRQFKVQLNENNYMIPEVTDNFVTVVHMDYDIAWLLDQKDKVIYFVSLCKVCSLINIT